MSLLRTGSWMFGTLALLVAAAARADEVPSIRLVEKSAQRPAEFVVVDLPSELLKSLSTLEPTDPEFARIFTVTVLGQPSDAAIPPVSGKYRVEESRLVFVPRFPPQAGLTYRAVIHSDQKVERDLAIPKAEVDVNRVATQVQNVYPSLDVLPENHLRFYIHFNQPMARGAAYENLELLDEQGHLLEASFLELGEELWDPSGQRFTLLLDPGRIKRGLKPREEDGPILEEGKQYTLVIKRDWRDAQGQMLKADYRKTFKAGPAVEKALDVREWKLSAPHSQTSGYFSVAFPYPLDRALLEHMLTIADPQGQRVAGQLIVCGAERRWTFRPDTPWRTGRYNLVVDTVLEDPSGNRIGRAFEVDQVESVTSKIVPEFITIPFDVNPKVPSKAPQ